MVTLRLLPTKKMCNITSFAASDFHHLGSKRQYGGLKNHQCLFRILQCSRQQLCILCFLIYYFAMGNFAAAQNATTTIAPRIPDTGSAFGVQCVNGSCYLKIPSNEEALKKMVSVSEQLYESYSTRSDSKKYVGTKGIENLFKHVGLIQDEHAGHDHEGHDHGHEGHDHGHEGHDHGHEGHDHGEHEALNPDDWTEEFADYFPDFMNPNYNKTESRKRRSTDEVQCIKSVDELVKAYFNPNTSDPIQLDIGDFMTLLPQIVLNMKMEDCRTIIESEEDDHDHETVTRNPIVEHSTRNVWLISFGSVLLISLVSLLGVIMIPLIRHTKLLNQIISFLVALAVGTLTGDALLHLLPHATGAHDHGAHEGHDHGGHDHGEEEEDHFASMWKGLVACMGIYAFFILETGMGFIRNRKSNKKHHHSHNHDDHSCQAESPSTTSPSNQKNKESTVVYSPSDSPLLKVNGKSESNGRAQDGHVIVVDEELMDTGHNHNHSREVPKTIASLAWMIVMGDGLHNVTDGLAIGAAFTSSIGAGLGTSLAIFFHEIPQELGDFAILLNSGMSVKQALLCNFLSACMCFIGLIIGLLVGNYTSGIILWILAFTAGGFLYIALVDMLPAMIKQLEHKDYKRRFLVQNIGILAGFGVMVIIALKEESFTQYF